MPLADVERFVARRFPLVDRAQALALLRAPVTEDGSLASPRLVRCAAVASQGSLQRLAQLVELLKVDWRDVILAGEYSAEDIQIRDLNQPVGDDA